MKCFKNLLLKNLVSGALIILAGQSVFAENSENKSPLKGVFESIKVEAVRSKSTYDSQSGDLSVDHN